MERLRRNMLIISDKNFYGRWKRKLNTIRDFPEDVSYLFDLQRTFYQTLYPGEIGKAPSPRL